MSVIPPITLSLEQIGELPKRVYDELNEVGGFWQIFTIWAHKKA